MALIAPPHARGSVPFNQLRDFDFDKLLPARSSSVYGNHFSEALECLLRSGRRRNSLDQVLASSAALQIGLLELLNERADLEIPPKALAASAHNLVEVAVSSSESSTSLQLHIELDGKSPVDALQTTR